MFSFLLETLPYKNGADNRTTPDWTRQTNKWALGAGYVDDGENTCMAAVAASHAVWCMCVAVHLKKKRAERIIIDDMPEKRLLRLNDSLGHVTLHPHGKSVSQWPRSTPQADALILDSRATQGH